LPKKEEISLPVREKPIGPHVFKDKELRNDNVKERLKDHAH
jgi:hypothetical protein